MENNKISLTSEKKSATEKAKLIFSPLLKGNIDKTGKIQTSMFLEIGFLRSRNVSQPTTRMVVTAQ